MNFRDIAKIVNSKKERHLHPTGKSKLGFWKNNEAHGCRMCYLNRKLNEIIDELKELRKFGGRRT